MNFFKKILSLILLLSIGSVDAKKRGAQAPRAKQPTIQPARTQRPARVAPLPPVRQQPMTQPQSYAQALDAIKRISSDEVLINNTFNPEFISFVLSLNLLPIETQALLQAGANIHATWTDNNETNKNRLLSLNNTIQSVVPTERIKPAIAARPVIAPKPISQPSSINQVPRDLL